MGQGCVLQGVRALLGQQRPRGVALPGAHQAVDLAGQRGDVADGDREGAVPGMCDDEPGDVTWVRGVDYLKGWREAGEAAREWNAALCSAGLPRTSCGLWLGPAPRVRG